MGSLVSSLYYRMRHVSFSAGVAFEQQPHPVYFLLVSSQPNTELLVYSFTYGTVTVNTRRALSTSKKDPQP